MATMTRSAYGLASLGDDWRLRAVCTPDLHTDYHRGSDQPTRARHNCLRHCPALAECARYTDRLAESGRAPYGIVQAGLVWCDAASRQGPIAEQPPDPGCGPWCKDLRGVTAYEPNYPGDGPHGLRRYRQGCRCAPCRAGNAKHQRDWKASLERRAS